MWLYYFISQTLMRCFFWKSFPVRNFFTSFSYVSLTRFMPNLYFYSWRDKVINIFDEFRNKKKRFWTNYNFVVILGTSGLRGRCQISLLSLIEFNPLQPVLLFHTFWKHQKTFRFSDVFRRYRRATPDCNGLSNLINFNDPLYFETLQCCVKIFGARFFLISDLKVNGYGIVKKC